MSEFIDRMSAQRRVVQIVNGGKRHKEELFSLSSKAIDRWMLANSVTPESRLAELLRDASKQLLCLATKSQEQITEDYKQISSNVALITRALEAEIGQ